MGAHQKEEYQARRYRLNLNAVYWKTDTVSTDDDLKDLERLHQGRQAHCIIWEDEPLRNRVNKLAEMGIEIAAF